MCSRPHNTDLTYMEGTGPCGPMRIIFGSGINSWYTMLNIKFGAIRTFVYMEGTRSCRPI